jgi:hypothetical protein
MISAAEFKRIMEPIFNIEKSEFKSVEDAKNFTEHIKPNVHSIYRCSPQDKLMFV